MKCNVCGGEIPAGAATCPICGAPAPAADAASDGFFPGTDMNQQPAADPFAANQPAQGYGAFDPAQQAPSPYGDPYGQSPMDGVAVSAPAAPPKSHTGLIIGIIVGVAVVAALVIMWVLGVFGGGNHDGTYELDKASLFGMEVTGEQLKTYGLDGSKYSIKISGGSATLIMDGNEISCDVSFSGDKVSFSNGGQTLEGTCSGNSITISYSGIELSFKK